MCKNIFLRSTRVASKSAILHVQRRTVYKHSKRDGSGVWSASRHDRSLINKSCDSNIYTPRTLVENGDGTHKITNVNRSFDT